MGNTRIDRKNILALCETLLTEMEQSEITLEQAVYKALHIARLEDDLMQVKWLRLELAGYGREMLPVGLTEEDANTSAYLANRAQTITDSKTGETKMQYYIASIPALEADIASDKLALQEIKMPAQVNPIKDGYTVETYATVLKQVTNRQNELKKSIKQNQELLGKVKSSLYTTIFTKYSKYRFDSSSDSTFQRLKDKVDARLEELIPDALQQLNAAYARLAEGGKTERSQALSTCRNLLYAFADVAYPPGKGKVTLSDGSEVIITAEKHKNRILAFLDQAVEKSDNTSRLNRARAEELFGRIQHLHSLQSEGTKTTVTAQEAELAILDTYLLLAQLIDFIPKANPKPSQKRAA